MKRLNSNTTFYQKVMFPACWFGALILVGGGMTVAAITKGNFSGLLNQVPVLVFFGVFGYFMMRWLVFDLVDEVWDEGSSLLVRNRRQEVRIPLADIMNISYAGMQNPPRVTLQLRQPTALGNEVVFTPPFRLFSFRMPPEVRELTKRVDDARRARFSQPSA